MEDYRKMYFEKRGEKFPEEISFLGKKYQKKLSLRYGTNPHQASSFYTSGDNSFGLGNFEIIKGGKGGLSETNLLDVNYALNIIKYFPESACAIMKHLNPTGVAKGNGSNSLKEVYLKARQADPQAAFGGVVVFNQPVDKETASEIMGFYTEVVAAPGYSQEALEEFNKFKEYARNQHLRILKIEKLERLPKFINEAPPELKEVKVTLDGSIILSEPLLTNIRSKSDLKLAQAKSPQGQEIKIERVPTERELEELLSAWYVTISVRSNGVVIWKDDATLSVGTGQQDRLAAVRQAIGKVKDKYQGKETLQGAVLASDGFFPFRDCIDEIAQAGLSGVVQPGGALRDYEVIEACNQYRLTMVFTGERCFAHH
jgi:phosphoribosylaminoimidazolecarboxamide formyltransferase/IMP cyclohydrolase